MSLEFLRSRPLRSLWKRSLKSSALVLTTIVTVLAVALFSVSPLTAAPKVSVQFVSPNWVAANIQDPKLKVLDVRNAPLEYIAGHLPKAVHIADAAFRGSDGFLPVQYWDTQKLASLLSKSGINRSDRVLVYSDARDVLGATMVAYLLERSGVSDIAVLDGGYAGYKASGQTVTKEYPKYQFTQFALQDKPAIRVKLNDVAQLIGKPGVVFIDPRPGDLFRGEKDVWVRNGHIPGAKNIPWPTFTEADNAQEALKNPHKLKSLDEIRKILASKNIKSSDNIVVTCSTGREATLQYVVLKHLLGYPNVRVYEGSWTEYSTSNLPVETGPEKA
jgi:thiosulfate/3-mercaptopyruvate sulfurtransferase